jgi:hypothetical protein
MRLSLLYSIIALLISFNVFSAPSEYRCGWRGYGDQPRYVGEWTNQKYVEECLKRLNWNITTISAISGFNAQMRGGPTFYGFLPRHDDGSAPVMFHDHVRNLDMTCRIKYFGRKHTSAWVEIVLDGRCHRRLRATPDRIRARHNSLSRFNPKSDLGSSPAVNSTPAAGVTGR